MQSLTTQERSILLKAGILFGLEAAFLIGLKALTGAGPVLQGSPSYAELAWSIVQSGSINFVSRPPLYPMLLAVFMKIADSRWTILALCLQGVTFVMIGLFIMRTTLYLSNSRSAMAISGLLYGTHILFALESLAQRETVFFSFILLLTITVAVIEPTGRKALLTWSCSLAVLCALAHLIRPNGFILAGCIALYLVSRYLRDPFRVPFAVVKIFLAVFVLFVLPWQLRLWSMAGKPTIAAAETAGINLWKGSHPELEEVYPWVDLDELDDAVRAETEELQLGDLEVDDHFISLARKNIADAPLSYLRRFAYKLLIFILPIPTPFGIGEIQEHGDGLELKHYTPNWRTIVVGTPYSIILFAGVAIFFMRSSFPRRQMRDFATLSLLTIVLFACSFAMTFVETRYRLPFEMELIVISSVGLAHLFESALVVPRRQPAVST